MDNEGVKIRYGDVAPEAKESFTASVTEKESFVDLSDFQKYNLNFKNFGNPCEYGSVVLNSSAEPFPDSPESKNMGLWSINISKSDGTFETSITLTLTAEAQYTSQGLTLTFDTYNNIFCNDLTITWYRNETQLATENFVPNSAFYFCKKYVENYTKIIIVFKRINMPYNRLKLRAIDYGYGTYFRSDELRNVNVIQEISPISSELSINTVDFTLDSNTDMEYSFQSKQPLNVYFNGELRATTFVKKSKRLAKNIWQIESEDYIGQLSKLTFLGDVYENKNAKELLENIFNQAKIPVLISNDLSKKTITGYIPICNCRDAIKQICFSIGAVADTANSDVVNIRCLSNDITQLIPLSRIRQGQSFDEEERVTEVNVTSHSYIRLTGEDNAIEAYNAEKNGEGNNILVKFSEPLHSLEISNGEILKQSANYAIISTSSKYCTLIGHRYDDVTTVYSRRNPVISASDIENVVDVSDVTLINPINANEVLTRVYTYTLKRNKTDLSIVEGKTEGSLNGAIYGAGIYGKAVFGRLESGIWIYDNIVNVGEVITAQTQYLGNVTGRIVSQRYNLNGGIIVKECEII